jgi:transposase
MRWKRLKDKASLDADERAELDAFIAQAASRRTARAWLYKERRREILGRKQINVVRTLLLRWATGVMRSKVYPMKTVASMIRKHLEGLVAWTRTRQTNGFLEAINGLFQAAKRKARGYTSFSTIRTIVFLLAGKLDFSNINPHLG